MNQAAIYTCIQQWLDYLVLNKRYSQHTVNAYRQDLVHLCSMFTEENLSTLTEHNIRHAIATLRSQGLSPKSLSRILAAWRGFFGWYAPKIGLKSNPAKNIKAPKAARKLPNSLSVEQAQVLLDRPNLPAPKNAIEWRDQAMFEILYSSGLRLSELISLDHVFTNTPDYQSSSWIQFESKDAVITGKGNKTRIVPIGTKAIQAVNKWLEYRPEIFAKCKNQSLSNQAALFLGTRGARISPRVVQIQLDKLAVKAGLPVAIHPHSLRHSFASHVLQSSQDLRAVQEMLGHSNISTTQIYTQLDFQHLASVYDKAHPRANKKDD